MKEFIIPVVFDVSTENDIASELDVAKTLATILKQANLVGQEPYGRGPVARIESWHMQNHPAADGSDHEAAIIFFPLIFDYRLEGESGPERAQRNIDRFRETTARWLKQ